MCSESSGPLFLLRAPSVQALPTLLCPSKTTQQWGQGWMPLRRLPPSRAGAEMQGQISPQGDRREASGEGPAAGTPSGVVPPALISGAGCGSRQRALSPDLRQSVT